MCSVLFKSRESTDEQHLPVSTLFDTQYAVLSNNHGDHVQCHVLSICQYTTGL